MRRDDFELEKTFEREFEGIRHYEKLSQNCPGLVDVLHVGRDQEGGFYYYVMELADHQTGESINDIDPALYRPKTLASVLKLNPVLSISDCVVIGHSLAEALAHLHQEGLVHRDVKPSNIIYVKGSPKLADIGLVTRGGQRTYVGTEGYVPPEGPGSGSADLYALAMVLYEMQTGKDRLDFPELPSHLHLGPTVNRDEWRALNAVVCRAGSPDPSKRFENGHVLAQALRRIKPERFPERAAAFPRKTRSPALVAILGGTAISLLAALMIFYLFSKLLKDAPDPKPRDPEVSFKQPIDKSDSAPVIVNDSAMESRPPEISSVPPSAIVAVPVETNTRKVRFDSVPGGASLWINGQEIGKTPIPQFEAEFGTLDLLFRKEGFLEHHLTPEIIPGIDVLTFRINLIPDRRPTGASWTNSLSLTFSRNSTGEYISSVPTSTYTGFLTSTGRLSRASDLPLAVVGPVGDPASPSFEAAPDDPVALVTDTFLAWAFCDWMTDYDRQYGYLDGRQYHAPVFPPPGAPPNSFFCGIKSEFESMTLNSEPEGAEIRDAVSGRLLGMTPATLSLRRGTYFLEVSKNGFRPRTEKGYLLSGNAIAFNFSLLRDESVVFGEPWKNSQSMLLVPVGSMMVAQYETRLRDYLEFQPGLETTIPANHPATGLSRGECEAFCRWLTEKERREGRIRDWHVYRLPTDREWSHLAGLPDEEGDHPLAREDQFAGLYLWGTDWPPPPGSGNFAGLSSEPQLGKFIVQGYDDPFPFTAPVGSFAPQTSGLHDLSGNAWEWVSDSYDGENQELGVVRGGGWDSYQPGTLQLSYRNAVSPLMRESSHGFRYVLVDLRREKAVQLE